MSVCFELQGNFFEVRTDDCGDDLSEPQVIHGAQILSPPHLVFTFVVIDIVSVQNRLESRIRLITHCLVSQSLAAIRRPALM